MVLPLSSNKLGKWVDVPYYERTAENAVLVRSLNGGPTVNTKVIDNAQSDTVPLADMTSGVALATLYRYFRSKEHLLAAALEDWQKRLTRRILAARRSTDEGPLPGMLDYLQRAQRAFHRSPNMTALMLQAMTSADSEAKAAIDHMNRTNVEMFNRLLEGVAEDDIPNVSFGINAVLSNALAGVLAGMLTLDESLDRVEWVARTLIGATTSRSV
jgi:TetR/AcrR family transcriptional regulator, cholesterol catabolism regulator